MAAPHILRRSVAPVALGALAASAVFLPRRTHAESPEASAIPIAKKPIYDDPHPPPSSDEIPSSSGPAEPLENSQSADTEFQPAATTPTPTDRLAVYIRSARLQLYNVSSQAETQVNNVLTRALRLENSFTNTVASLAPPPEAHEPLLPGFTYVFVSTLAGSILTRNRGILLRFTVPLVFGVAAAEATLPHTMSNVGDLIWTYEERYPQLAETHIRVKERVQRFWETGKAHSATAVESVEEKVGDAKKSVQDWVKKGK